MKGEEKEQQFNKKGEYGELVKVSLGKKRRRRIICRKRKKRSRKREC